MSELGGDLAQGVTVGEYVVDRKIAEGGMGAVYAGHHPVIGKRVAVKVLAPQCAAVPDLVRRFVEEARAVNKIGHPNIIDIFSFGALTDRRPYFVMEYLEGASLAARIQDGTLTASETRRILKQVCGALEAAHRAGIVHRDLKPENIWIASPAHEDSYAKVLDFGIAKLLDNQQARNTQTGTAMGTPRYMAPEQCMGHAVDHRADVYSFGVMLYEIFAGVVPFRGESFGELIYQHMSETPEPPSRHRPIDPDLEKLILDCLEKDPARRPQSAKEVGRRLDLALREGTDRLASPAPTLPLPPGPQAPPATTLGQSIGEVGRLSVAPPGAARARTLGVTFGVTAAVVVVGLLLMRGRPAHPVAAPSPSPSVSAGLPPPSGGLHLRIENGRADSVSLDGREIARSAADVDFGAVPPGDHMISIEVLGQPVQTRPVTVTAGTATTLSMELAPAPVVAPAVASGAPGRAHHAVHGAAAQQTASAIPPSGRATPTPGGAKARGSRAEEHGLMDENPFRKP